MCNTKKFMNAFFEDDKCDCCDKRSSDVMYRILPDMNFFTGLMEEDEDGDKMNLCDDCYNSELKLRNGMSEEESAYENGEFVSITDSKVIMDFAKKINY